jgi:hypothetical protein
LALSASTDQYAALNILSNDTAVGCNDPSRVTRSQFVLADGACHKMANDYYTAQCASGGNVTISVCSSSDCKDCKQTLSGTDGVCSNTQTVGSKAGGPLADAGTPYYMQCFSADAGAGAPSPADDNTTLAGGNGTDTGDVPGKGADPSGADRLLGGALSTLAMVGALLAM